MYSQAKDLRVPEKVQIFEEESLAAKIPGIFECDFPTKSFGIEGLFGEIRVHHFRAVFGFVGIRQFRALDICQRIRLLDFDVGRQAQDETGHIRNRPSVWNLQ